MQPFIHIGSPARIVFGRGSIARTAEEVRTLGATRALILSTPQQRQQAEALANSIGSLRAGIFDGATMHTPVEVTERALAVLRDCRADCLIALGGGSTTGLGKALAVRSGAPHVAIPTTYAGSEVTPILGETVNGEKTTRRSPDILPQVVIYDPALTDTLPRHLAITSGLNAMAHAAEGVYARDGSPIYTVMALEGLRALRDALPAIIENPEDSSARDLAVYGAWLCGTVLGGVGMSIHHKLCHTLGGALNLPHADTHAILLPHTMAFVEEAEPQCLAPVAALFGGQAGTGLYDFARSVGAPFSLASLKVTEAELDDVTEQALSNPYWSPRPLDRSGIRNLLQRALTGERPV